MKYIQRISAKLDFLNQDININLKGRNLILTGKNGVGKTRFLNQLNAVVLNKLVHEIPHLPQHHYSCKQQIIQIINSEISHLPSNNIYQNYLENLESLLIKTDSYNIIENRKFVEIATKLKDIIINHHNFSSDENFRYRHSQIHEIDHYFNELGYMNSHEHINLVVTGIGNLSENIQASKVTFNFFPAHRQSQITASTNTTDLNQYINTAKHEYSSKLGQFLEQYLLNIKIEKSLALSEEQDTNHAGQIDQWFKKFDEDLKFLFEDSTTQLKFDYKLRKFSLLQSYREFTFQSLSSGFTAIFDIYSDLLMRSRLLNILPNELNGVVLIDEIDAHLHISLQKKILPFLSQSFPEIQFIVSTHSPFVITSTNNDTVVYDLSTGDFFEEDLSFFSHESIIKELFHVKDENENLKQLSDKLLQFINSENSTQDLNEIQHLLNEINKDFEKLSVEFQLQYIVAKNKLAKLKHEGN
ncbi:MAG: AAA family ATPase [Acinetobacter sp.]